jgi:dienelactone hydrolase
MRRLFTWVGVGIASLLPVVTLSASMVWLLPPPARVLAVATRVVRKASGTPDRPVPGPALERRHRKVTHDDAPRGFITVQASPTPDRTLLMQVYPARDANAATPRRAVVILHGADWPAVDSGLGAQASAWLASQGYHVFDVQAQQGGDGAVEDGNTNVKCAVGWIKHNARARLGHFGINVDPTRVALLGRRQAGALALASATPTDAAVHESCAGEDPAVDAAISFYGPSNVSAERARPGAPAMLIIRGAQGSQSFHDKFGGRFGEVMRTSGAHAKAGPQGVFLRDLEIPIGRPGFDLVFGARGEGRAEAAVARFLSDLDERRL